MKCKVCSWHTLHPPELIRRPAHTFVSSVSREYVPLCNLRYVHVFICRYRHKLMLMVLHQLILHVRLILNNCSISRVCQAAISGDLCEVALYIVNYVTTMTSFKNSKVLLIEANVCTNR